MQDKGKAAEKAVTDWLVPRSNSDLEFAWMRLPDARSARGAIAAQPSDFKVSRKSHQCWHMEVKETVQVRRLSKSKIRQYGLLQKWWLAGVGALVVVHMTEIDTWTYLTGHDLFQHDVCPASFLLSGPRYATADELLSTLFGPIRS